MRAGFSGAGYFVMTRQDFNSYCSLLPASTHVVQWSGSDVWKVGGKVFAIAGRDSGQLCLITFKCSHISFDVLKDLEGLRPAPYLAPRGGKWIQMYAEPGLDDMALREYLSESHRLVASKLTRKSRAELGL